jgi:phosphohistidine phosphatase
MRLLFLRHGIAEDAGPGRPDLARALTAEGRELMIAAAAGMRSLAVQPDAILTSPLVRARQTAEIVAEALGLQDRLREDDRLPGCELGDLQDIVAEHPNAEQLLLVGHQPDMSVLIGTLIGNGRVRMGKGSLACVEGIAGSGGGELRWLLTAPQLARLRSDSQTPEAQSS